MSGEQPFPASPQTQGAENPNRPPADKERAQATKPEGNTKPEVVDHETGRRQKSKE